MDKSVSGQLTSLENNASENSNTPQLNARALSQRRRRARERASRSLSETTQLVNASTFTNNRSTAQSMRRQNEILLCQQKGKGIANPSEELEQPIIMTYKHLHWGNRYRFVNSIYEEGETSSRSRTTSPNTVNATLLASTNNRSTTPRMRRRKETVSHQRRRQTVTNQPQSRSTSQRMRRENESVTRQRKRKATANQHEGNMSAGQHTQLVKRIRFNSSCYEEGEPSNRSQTTSGNTVDEFPQLTSFSVEDAPTMILDRHSLGLMEVVCPHCKALHWLDEKLSNSRTDSPLFGTCCLQRKIQLPQLREPPMSLKALYDGTDAKCKAFRCNIRRYNASNAFTSLGCNLDRRNFNGQGPVSFTIHGELRHRTGSLLPEDGTPPSYAQLYIYDPSSALNIRCRRNDDLDVSILQIIQDTLISQNAFFPIYKQAHEILMQLNSSGKDIPVSLQYNAATDRRRYNLPTTDEIAIIIPGDGTEICSSRDIVLHLKGGTELMRISDCHPAYLPLHYVLLFPYGELGWYPELKQWDTKLNRISRKRLTQMQFFGHRLFQRLDEYSTILRACNLFQEFLVDAWASTEQNRLNYIRLHQSKLRSELYNGLTDMASAGLQPDQIGRRFILPSSFTGSSRHLFEIYQDSMAITRYHHHPDIFLTMTANPKWPEIAAALLPNQTPIDRPDLVARVFELKRKKLMTVINKDGLFGKAVAHVYTIEFQKRGLPHMHALIFLQKSDKIHRPSQVDQFISAEFPDQDADPLLFETVKNCMVHGPCGLRRPTSPCMINGKCSKGYPRKFVDKTTIGEDGYPIYRRRNDGRAFFVRGHFVDNRDVVPYNPHLSKLFDCHINVEVCASVRCVKYINKYIYKGGDRTTMVVGATDEIQQYLDSRYIAPPEAAWRLFGYLLHEEYPSVVRLAVHLPGMHHVVFQPMDNPESVQYKADNEISTLMAFFFRCGIDPMARNYTSQEFPQHYVWDKQSKIWGKRKKGFSIGRMYFVNPNEGERFYLRLLLIVVKGPESFESLRTVNGEVYNTFKSACVARGLLEDDGEWILCLEEAAKINTGYQLRRLFCIILLECAPLNPSSLWDRFALNICDDLGHQLHITRGITEPTDSQIRDFGLHLLNEILLEYGKSLKDDFSSMPQPNQRWNQISGNRFIWEHMQLQTSIDDTELASKVDLLNSAQNQAFEAIVSSVNNNEGLLFFLNGGAGTGKTFLYNTIAATCRKNGNIVITVASSGIASLLLVGGRTAHSTFRIPLDVHEDSVCNIGKQTALADFFRASKLIIWDEVPMQHKYCVEAVDRSLQDIRNNNKPFGGLTVVLGGDFRQILPVVPKGVREQIVGASLRRSFLWINIKVITLSQNMRLQSNDADNHMFRTFLQQVGTTDSENLPLPPYLNRCRTLEELVSAVYPELNMDHNLTTNYLTQRTILSARNEDVSAINTLALNITPGEMITYLAADKMNETEDNDYSFNARYPNEFLNSLNPSGLPPFKLQLKIGSPIMLLRNLSPKDGLCNGTRLMVVNCGNRVLEAKILTGDKRGNMVFIPRISLTPSSSELNIQFTRRQFPVRLAYAMTINKSQGQSVTHVGVDLRFPVFSHGQLYVALSRCTDSKRVHILLPENSNLFTTTNVVYNEVLL